MEQAPLIAIREAQPRGIHTQLRAFLGLCNVYRRFVLQYSHMAALLKALLKKGQPVKLEEFGRSETSSFDTL